MVLFLVKNDLNGSKNEPKKYFNLVSETQTTPSGLSGLGIFPFSFNRPCTESCTQQKITNIFLSKNHQAVHAFETLWHEIIFFFKPLYEEHTKRENTFDGMVRYLGYKYC